MAKECKSTAVPRLRFPEFREAGPWDRRKLSELLRERKQRNRALEFGSGEVLSVSGDHGCVNQIELLGRSYAGVSVKDYHIVETGDLVYTKSPLKRNPYGIIKENKGKPGIVSTLYAVYHVTELGHPAYLDHYFSRDYNLNSYLQPIVRKGAKNDMKVNNAAVLSGEILAPKIPEQQKIADCLTSLDEVIAAQGRKVEILRTYKRGLMQQLFPREGETIPRIRFPEFQDGERWEEKPLKEICEINPANNGLPESFIYIDLGSVEGGVLNARKRIEKRDAPSRAQRLLKNGDVVFQIVRPYQRNNLFVRFDDDEVYVASTGYAQLRAKDSEAFLYQVVHTDSFVDRVIAKCTGLNYPAINSSDLADVLLPVPPTVRERKIIADCLASLDSQITADFEKLCALKAHKQGLMQQLFTSSADA